MITSTIHLLDTILRSIHIRILDEFKEILFSNCVNTLVICINHITHILSRVSLLDIVSNTSVIGKNLPKLVDACIVIDFRANFIV